MHETSTLDVEGTITNELAIGLDGTLPGYVSEALYWEKYYNYVGPSDRCFEWNNGQLEELPVTDYAKFIMYLWFLDVLRDFLHANPIARIIGLELGFRLVLPQKVTIRKPDLGLVLNTNPVPLNDHDRLPRIEGIVYSQVLPGFRFRVADLYTRPTPPELVDDPVYSSFISPLYRAERQRAEFYANLLRAAGLLPPSEGAG